MKVSAFSRLVGLVGALAVVGAVQPLHANETQIRAALEPRLGKIDHVGLSPVPGIWEVVVGPRVQYADPGGRFLFDGPLRDAATGKDLTAQRQFSLLPLDVALVQKHGTGQHVLISFEDPNCGYCKRLAHELAKVPNLKVYTFLYPILGSDSMEKAKNIWCAPDRTTAWNAYMLHGKAAPKAKDSCDIAGLLKSLDTGRKLGLRGTPIMYLSNGETIRGFTPSEQLMQRFRNGS